METSKRTKSIKVFVVTPNPYNSKNTLVTSTDPDEGVDYSSRSNASGHALPYIVQVPETFTTQEGEFVEHPFFDGETAISFHLCKDGFIRSKPAWVTGKVATEMKAWRCHKSIRITNNF